MLTACNSEGVQVIAWECSKDQGPFTCPECNSAVILKKGNIVTHHFAHVPPVNCQYGLGETQIHLRVKREIYEALLVNPNVRKLALERSLGEVRPDISCYIRNQPVAIEVQRSNVSSEVIIERFWHYTSKKVSMLWVVTDDPLEEFRSLHGRVQLPQWKRLLTAIYRGKLYVHRQGEQLRIVEFGKFRKYVRTGNARHLTYCNITDGRFRSRWCERFDYEDIEINDDILLYEHDVVGRYSKRLA